LKTTGEFCPFCGITRDVGDILKGNFIDAARNIFSYFCFFLLIFEIIFRIILILGKFKQVRRIIWVDLIIHSVLYMVFTLAVFYKITSQL
jgi:uncharacterized protein DUF2752